MCLLLYAPLSVGIDRDSKRKKPHGKDAAKVIYKKVTELNSGTVIDVTKPLEQSIAEILSHLPLKNKRP